jgi:predicted transposase YdaD
MNIEDVILEAVREETREDEKKQIALRMKKAGFSTADIAKATGLTMEQIKKF